MKMKITGSELIAAEQKRQLAELGGLPDGRCAPCELRIAAACYAVEGTDSKVTYIKEDKNRVRGWPGDAVPDKRTEYFGLKQLVVAGALIATQIDYDLKQIEEDAIKNELIDVGL